MSGNREVTITLSVKEREALEGGFGRMSLLQAERRGRRRWTREHQHPQGAAKVPTGHPSPGVLLAASVAD